MQHPDYASVAAALSDLGSSRSAGATHGALSALLSSRPRPRAKTDWFRAILADTSLDAAQIAGMPLQFHLLDQLFTATALQMLGDDFEFALFLPDDQEPLALRSSELAAWCAAFCDVYQTDSIVEEHQEKSLEEQQSESEATHVIEEEIELLEDFRAISELEPDHASEDDDNEHEAAQADLQELVEFVRVGVMYLCEDQRARELQAEQVEPQQPVTH